MGEAYHKIMEYMDSINVQPMDVPFVIYYSMDMENLDVEMGFIVPAKVEGKDDIRSSTIPGGREASFVHKGPYAASEQGYIKLLEWIKEQGEEVTGVSYEFYYNSPEEVPEFELLTKIVFPLT
nr:GyrI-like domain-containing protein [Methanosalsum zhilinae]